MRKKITVVLVEDHKVVREGLRALIELEEDIAVIGEAENGIEAIRIIEHLHPTIVIMDIALPKLNGLEATKRILKSFPDMKILILSAYVDDGYILKATAIGVSGFLVKQCSQYVLIHAIREIVRGTQFFSPEVFDRLNVLNKSLLSRNGLQKKQSRALSQREVQVLQLIAEGKINKQIAGDLGISVKTVEKHRQNLMEKLSIHDIASLTRYAITEGIIESSSHGSVQT